MFDSFHQVFVLYTIYTTPLPCVEAPGLMVKRMGVEATYWYPICDSLSPISVGMFCEEFISLDEFPPSPTVREVAASSKAVVI
jgi:hypothetical protein